MGRAKLCGIVRLGDVMFGSTYDMLACENIQQIINAMLDAELAPKGFRTACGREASFFVPILQGSHISYKFIH